jgi:hypothetical protein
MAYERGEAYIDKDYWDKKGRLAIMLPHSCDEWVIGTQEDAKQLITDLEKLIKEFPVEPTLEDKE